MVQIYLSKEEYEYDVHSLVKAFYPGEQIKVITGRECGSCWEDFKLQDMLKVRIDFSPEGIHIKAEKNKAELYSETTSEKLDIKEEIKFRKQERNQLKRALYRCFVHLTGKELPWGTLTGVRPTKIAFEKMEHNICESDITQYMSEQYLCSEEKAGLSLKVAKREITLLNDIDYKNGYSIYIGIPFCPSTCLYCSFTSYSIERSGDWVKRYLNSLYQEITYAGTCGLNKKLTTIYLGGGTPTTLTVHELDGLLSHIRKSFDFTHVCEYTVEAGRPDSITSEKLQVLKAHGVTRISINPQTMSQKTLDLIGRKHSVSQVIEAFHMAREWGHDNINMDIIIGLPGESQADVSHTLEEIDQLKPDSLTVHTLALKRAARLNIERENYLDLAPEDTAKMLKLTSDYAKSANYLPYYLYRQKNMTDNLENIGYARYGREGLYNILIMEEKQTILALGAGALSKFIFHNENRIERVENVKSLKDYVERIDEMIERKRIFLKENFYGL